MTGYRVYDQSCFLMLPPDCQLDLRRVMDLPDLGTALRNRYASALGLLAFPVRPPPSPQLRLWHYAFPIRITDIQPRTRLEARRGLALCLTSFN